MPKHAPTPSAQVLGRREYDGILFLKQGFRPFFLGAGVSSALAMTVWLSFLVFGEPASLFGYFSPLDWHLHEMLFGFLPAAIAGFLLTAVPNWTGRLPVRGTPLALLALLWLGGRLIILASGQVPESAYIFIAIFEAMFLICFAALLAREILAGNNINNVPVVIIVIALAASNIAFHMITLELITDLSTSQIALAALLLAVLLVTLIGGRIVPSFTRNWMARNKLEPLPASRDIVDKMGSLFVPVAALMLLVAPQSTLAGVICILTALFHWFRLSRWRGLPCLREPMVFILHIGYFWIGVGFLLAGLSTFLDVIPMVASIHAFTAGMFGSMILAVMTRATLGHTGQTIEANRGTIIVFILVNLSAIIRVGSAIAGDTEWGYILSGLSWIGAFALFTLLYLPSFIKR